MDLRFWQWGIAAAMRQRDEAEAARDLAVSKAMGLAGELEACQADTDGYKTALAICRQRPAMEPPIVLPAVEHDQAWMALAISGRVPAAVVVIWMDNTYRVATEEDFDRIVRDDLTAGKLPYIPELADCDKVARRFWSLCPWQYGVNSVGMVIDQGRAHAYNLVVTQGADGAGLVRFFEPQDDAWVSFYPERGVILL